jgi:hypothetical protein
MVLLGNTSVMLLVLFCYTTTLEKLPSLIIVSLCLNIGLVELFNTM